MAGTASILRVGPVEDAEVSRRGLLVQPPAEHRWAVEAWSPMGRLLTGFLAMCRVLRRGTWSDRLS